MEKDSSNINNIENKKENGLTPKQKESLITVIVLICSIVVGFFIGKLLFDVLH